MSSSILTFFTMSLEPQPQPASFHRGSFADEIETARTDLARKLLVGGDSPGVSPSDLETAPSLSPAVSATSSTPESDAAISPISPPLDEELVADSFAFAFDIDGVLVRGGRPIPEALQAMKVLNGENQYGIKV